MLTPTIWKHGNTETTGSYQPQFVNALQTSGRMIYARIYQNGSLLFDESTINNITISIDGGFLKSIMRVVEIELNGLYYLLEQEFDSIQIGVSDDQGANIYYIDYGKFIVGPENEQSIETNTTKITCYDEMLKSMVPFTLQHTYTVNTTNRNFLYLIAQELGITLGSSIPSDGVMALYRNHETYTTQNTYRDVLDDFAEILGCCLTIKNGVLECKTGGSNVFVITEEQLKKINFKEPFNTITSLTLSRMPQEDNVSYPDNPSEGEAVKLENNLLVEGYQPDSGAPDRTGYLQPVYTTLHSIGMFYPIELESFGFCIYEPMDRLEVQVRDYSGNLIQLPIRWMNNTIKVGPGLDEDMECERPEFGETDYTKSSSSAIAERNTYLYVDKVGQTIEAHVESVEGTVGSLADRVPVNMLLDTNAPSLQHVYATNDRYWSNSGSANEYISAEIVAINAPPRLGIDYGALFTVISEAPSGKVRALTWYAGDTVKMAAGTQYTLSCYARLKTASDGTVGVYFGYGYNAYAETGYDENYQVASTSWVKYSWTFTADETKLNANGARVYIGVFALSGTSTGAVELCNFMLQEGTPSDVTAKGSSLQMDLNGIRGDIYEITKEGGTLDSKITASAGEILSTVSETYTTAEDVDGILTSKDYVTSSTLTQTSDNIKQEFSEQIKGIGTNSQDIAEIKTWIIGDINGVTVGKSNSAIRGRFSNSQLAFTDSSGNTKYAWLDAIEGLGASKISIGKPDSGSTSNLKKRWQIFASDDGTHLTFTRHS